MSLLAMLPSPIIFGSIIDNTCLLWQEECGETTNCLLYDTDRLRQALMLTTAGMEGNMGGRDKFVLIYIQVSWHWGSSSTWRLFTMLKTFRYLM